MTSVGEGVCRGRWRFGFRMRSTVLADLSVGFVVRYAMLFCSSVSCHGVGLAIPCVG